MSPFGRTLKLKISFRNRSAVANLLADDLSEAFRRAGCDVEASPAWTNQVGLSVRVNPKSPASVAVLRVLHDMGLSPAQVPAEEAPADEIQLTVGDRPT